MNARILSAIATLAACNAPPATPVRTPVARTISIPDVPGADAVAAPSSALADADPPMLAAPAAVACTFATKALAFDVGIDGEGPPFAWIDSTGSLALPVGPARGGAFLDHAANGVHLRGFVQAKTLSFYLKKPVALGAWFVPQASTPVRWVSAPSTASLELSVDSDLFDPHFTRVIQLEAPRTVASCGDVAFDAAATYDGAAFALKGRASSIAYVLPGEAIPLARDPNGPPVAELRFDQADAAQVRVVGRKGAHSLVVVTAWEPATLYGWIPTSVIVPAPTKLVGGQVSRAPSLRQGRTRGMVRRRVVCEERVSLLAESGGRRARVGEIDAHVPFVFVLEQRTDGTRDVELDDVLVASGARLFASDAVERCANTSDRKDAGVP